jgi:pimeloyl-ACP methyl ester carboxylesterase
VRNAVVTTEGDQIRWVELPGRESARVYVHGLGATSPACFAEIAVHPLLGGQRPLLIDLLGHGISDRPTHFDYSLEAHADALAEALASAGVTGCGVDRATAWVARYPSSWPPGIRTWCPVWCWLHDTRSIEHPLT